MEGLMEWRNPARSVEENRSQRHRDRATTWREPGCMKPGRVIDATGVDGVISTPVNYPPIGGITASQTVNVLGNEAPPRSRNDAV
jgi:hypothetical protein